jgi:serine/threonine-protein kinase
MPKVCPVCDTVYPDANAFCPVDGTTLHVVDLEGGLIGSVVADRYLVTDLLGEGGMGKVYLARHVRLPQQAAIKVLRPEMVKDPAAVARFNREASNASRIDDENVARVYDFGEAAGGTVYLAMEYVAGISLRDLLERDGPMEPRRAAGIVEQIGRGLDAAHRLKIIHRDLKPDNILVIEGHDGRDRVKVVDFGIAKAFGAEEGNLTRTGFVVGTPEFMSPEQLTGRPLDARSDVFALGLVAYQCLTGALPFPGDTPEQKMAGRLMRAPLRLDEVSDKAWPPALQEVFDSVLSREVDKRSESAGAFARLFSAAMEAGAGGNAGAASGARGGAAATRAPSSTAAKGSTAALPQTERTPASRAPIIAGVVAVLAIGGYFGLRALQSPAGAPTSARTDSTAVAAPPAPATAPAAVDANVATPRGAVVDTAAIARAVRDSIGREIAARAVRDSAARRQTASTAATTSAPTTPPPAAVDPSLSQSLDSLTRALGRRGVDVSEATRIASALRSLAPRIPDPSTRATAYFRLIQASVLAGDLTGACTAFRSAKGSVRGEAQQSELRRFEEALGCS